MGIFDSFKKAARTFVEDINTPESFKKGQKFEDFTREVIFSVDRYKLIKKTHDYKQNSIDFVQDSLEPDFKFECKDTGKQFYVESKFRTWFYQGKIEFCKNDQFKRLQEINKKEPVFILIGLDGEPKDPEYVLLIPMSDIKSNSLSEEFLENYDIAHNVSIPQKKLWSLVDQSSKKDAKEIKTKIATFQKKPDTGYCIRCKDELKIDVKHPFCKTCYSEWNKHKNPTHIEKYCHICGNANKGSFAKPVCYSCYKSQ
ncbi:MAG TPA: hypothetical protein VMV77_21410 [Bacteroidales bacterium]|nr:hypothetical protein [Bacteroidales bacterium]